MRALVLKNKNPYIILIMIKVIKRDGSEQIYNFEKIKSCVERAFASVSDSSVEKFMAQIGDYFASYIDKLTAKAKDDEVFLNVEDIQDMIRNFLITKNKYKVVESFILYRDERDRIRQDKTKLMRDIKSKLRATNVQNQNANVDEESFGGRMGEASSVVLKDQALAYMSKRSRDNHNKNYVYIHDLDQYVLGSHNCLSYPIDESLGRGFTVRQTDVRPANSVNTAM